MFEAIDDLLLHIKEVQLDVIELSEDSLLKMSHYIEKNSLEVDEEITMALQYQDIITQQLNATVEAIQSMKKSIEVFAHADNSSEKLAQNSALELQEKLSTILQEAKDKKSRFSGKITESSSHEEIEFF